MGLKAKGVEKVLMIDGAGFIGSHTAGLLIEYGYHITILDSYTRAIRYVRTELSTIQQYLIA